MKKRDVIRYGDRAIRDSLATAKNTGNFNVLIAFYDQMMMWLHNESEEVFEYKYTLVGALTILKGMVEDYRDNAEMVCEDNSGVHDLGELV